MSADRSVLSMFDPLRALNTPSTPASSSESFNNNCDTPSSLTMTSFFNRTIGRVVKSKNHKTPKGGLVDIFPSTTATPYPNDKALLMAPEAHGRLIAQFTSPVHRRAGEYDPFSPPPAAAMKTPLPDSPLATSLSDSSGETQSTCVTPTESSSGLVPLPTITSSVSLPTLENASLRKSRDIHRQSSWEFEKTLDIDLGDSSFFLLNDEMSSFLSKLDADVSGIQEVPSWSTRQFSDVSTQQIDNPSLLLASLANSTISTNTVEEVISGASSRQMHCSTYVAERSDPAPTNHFSKIDTTPESKDSKATAVDTPRSAIKIDFAMETIKPKYRTLRPTTSLEREQNPIPKLGSISVTTPQSSTKADLSPRTFPARSASDSTPESKMTRIIIPSGPRNPIFTIPTGNPALAGVRRLRTTSTISSGSNRKSYDHEQPSAETVDKRGMKNQTPPARTALQDSPQSDGRAVKGGPSQISPPKTPIRRTTFSQPSKLKMSPPAKVASSPYAGTSIVTAKVTAPSRNKPDKSPAPLANATKPQRPVVARPAMRPLRTVSTVTETSGLVQETNEPGRITLVHSKPGITKPSMGKSLPSRSLPKAGGAIRPVLAAGSGTNVGGSTTEIISKSGSVKGTFRIGIANSNKVSAETETTTKETIRARTISASAATPISPRATRISTTANVSKALRPIRTTTVSTVIPPTRSMRPSISTTSRPPIASSRITHGALPRPVTSAGNIPRPVSAMSRLPSAPRPTSTKIGLKDPKIKG